MRPAPRPVPIEICVTRLARKSARTAIEAAILRSDQVRDYKKRYAAYKLAIESIALGDCQYITGDVSQNASVHMKIVLAQLAVGVRNKQEKYTYPAVAFVLLYELVQAGLADSYSVMSIGDFAIPVDDANDVID